MDKVDSWFKRNKVDLIDGWTNDEYRVVVDSILNEKFVCIDDILPFLNNKTIEDLLFILRNILKIGNKLLRIRCICNFCGKITYQKMYKFGSIVYCDMNCRNEYKRQFAEKGEDSPFYKSIKIKCDNCGKEIIVPPNRLKRENRFGENFNFCCQTCCWEYKSKYYIKEKSNLYEFSHSEEQKRLSSRNALNNLKNGLYPQTMTKPHKIVCELLKEMNIDYINEKIFGHYSIDIFLTKFNLPIEIMGDYWHANPNNFLKNNLTSQQIKDIRIDLSKRSYILKHYGLNILNLWESNILLRRDLCKYLIDVFIKNNGRLDNLDSFNYDNDFKLNKIIIYPYFQTKIRND